MHILFVLNTWGLVGGTERYAAVVIPALLERGHDITVLCAERQGEDLADVPVLEAPELARRSSPQAELDGLLARVSAVAPDVVFVSALHNVDALSALIDALPLVRYVHDHVLFCPGLNKYREDGETCRKPMGWECLKRYWLDGGCVCFKQVQHQDLVEPLKEVRRKRREVGVTRRAARILTNSRYMRDELLRVGCGPDRTSVLPLFTRSNTAAQPPGPLPDETAAFVAGDAPVIFTPARLTLPDKGVDFLLTALRQVATEGRAVICGDGPAAEWLRAKAALEGIADRTHFTGWMGSPAIEALYARADVVVCPSVWDEPFGLVGLEAMAHRKPLVAFDVGGIPDWLSDGENGLLVPRKDTAAMAAAIDRVLNDAELAARLGERGAEILAERFSREAHMEGLERELSVAVSSA
ncbi:MAG: glycosyltransferase family 4 protein [Planctomycetota bacterium]